jgi:hypothetical protein
MTTSTASALSLLCAASLSAAAFLFVACAGDAEKLSAPAPGTASGPRIQLALEPGSQYSKEMKTFIFGYTVYPQVAAWIETEDGRFIETLYVTQIAVTEKYRAAPKNGRPEALPIWSALRTTSADAVSAPTTVGSTVRYRNGAAGKLSPGTYVVKLETNRSYDWNGTYTKQNSGVNGQPSLLYRAVLRVGGQRDQADFVPIGTGSVDGSDGNVRLGLEGIDTALELFSSMKVSYEID